MTLRFYVDRDGIGPPAMTLHIGMSVIDRLRCGFNLDDLSFGLARLYGCCLISQGGDAPLPHPLSCHRCGAMPEDCECPCEGCGSVEGYCTCEEPGRG